MENKTIITIDLGNSFSKIGTFINNKLVNLKRISWTDLMTDEKIYSFLKNLHGIYSSVLSKEQNLEFSRRFPQLIEFSNEIKIPIDLNYDTPLTLGKDRICNAIRAWTLNKNQNSLIIDIGTCIKYDLISKSSSYEGGAISPGIKLRYKSLNDYTANLPLIDEKGEIDLIGKSTKTSIHSGVINGIKGELTHLIAQYESNFDSLTIFMTGGDEKYFDMGTKNNIFVNENLTLEGLYEIYLFNVQ